MPDQLLITKLNAPPLRQGLVPRGRLTERLDRGLAQRCRLTLISAPAGYGKTTLTCDWLARPTSSNGRLNAESIAWLTVDDGDNDPVRFFTYLVAALRKVDASLGQATLDFLAARRLPPAATLITPLINDLALAPGFAVLVLDDLHAIDNLAIHDALDFLVQHAPLNLHVVALTREDPPLSLATLRARGQLTELRTHDLRFSDEEAGEFFKATMGLKLEPSVVSGLETRTEGWVAGLQLAALSVHGRPAEDLAEFLSAFSGTHRYIMDYLVEQVLSRLPAELRAFMCSVSILDRMCAPLCGAVIGDGAEGASPNSRAMLQQLDAGNLFLVRLDTQGQWFRFHHLFAELLRLELDAEQQKALHRRAAGWFEANDLVPEAIHHALAGEDHVRAARLVRLSAPGLLRTSELRTLLGWIEHLPERVVLEDAELAVHAAAAWFFTGDARRAWAFLDQIESCAHAGGLAPHVRGRLLALRAWQANLANDMPETQRAAAEARELVRDNPFYYMAALLPLGHAQSAGGETQKAERTYREAVEAGRQTGHMLVTAGGLVDLAFNLLEQGLRREAVDLCQDMLRRHVDRHGAPLPLAQLMYLPLGTAMYQANRLDEAQECAAKGLEASRQVLSEEIMGGDGEATLALCEFARGSQEPALARMEAACQATERLGYQRVALALAALHAELCLRKGDLTAARRWAESRGPALCDPRVTAHDTEYRVYVRCLLAEGRIQEARELLGAMEEVARAGRRQGRLITALLWLALADQAQGRRDGALAALKEAVSLAASEDYYRVFLDAGQPALLDMLPKVRPAAPEFVDALLAAANSRRDALPAAGPNQSLLEPLSPRELEVLRLLADGLSYREIAAALIVAQGTVQAHCGSIYGKLGANNRTQALARARELGLL